MQSRQLHDLAIIVCTRDRPGMLADALAALFDSVDDSVEVIVVDSASRDSRTREVTERTRAQYVRSDISGLSIARNVGLRATERAFVAYTDDDCRPVAGWTEELLNGFSSPEVAAVSGRMLDHTLAHTQQTSLPGHVYKTPIQGLDAGHGAVMAFRREALLDAGGFDEVLGAGRRLGGAEELDAFVRLIRLGHWVVNNPASIVLHANTREDVDYAKLYRGYGRGLGAMAGKWLRLSPPLGAHLLALSLFRAARRALRAGRRDARKRISSIALIEGTVAGVLSSLSMRLSGTTFVDAHPPVAKPLTAGDSVAPAIPERSAGKPARRSARARPIRILDEKFVANTLAFESARPAVTVVLEPGAFRLPSGNLDRVEIAAQVLGWATRTPALRQRLMTAPLGVLPPSWIPANEINISHHLRISDEVVSRDFLNTDLISGFHNPPMDMRRPLWSMLVVPLDTGELAFVGQIQHVIGDGVFSMKIIANMFTDDADKIKPDDLDSVRAPSNPVELLSAAVTSLRSDYASIGEAVADYKRKPFTRRVRRTVGRNLRPLRNRAIDRKGLVATLPKRHTRIIETDLTASKALARQYGGTLNDLTVALTLIGIAALNPGVSTVATFVPVAPRATGGKDVRNNIRMVRVEVPRSESIAEVLPQVRDQIAAAVEDGTDGIAAAGGASTDSYASFLPGSPRARHIGTAEATSVVLWPTLQPHDDLAVFGSSYRRTFALAITVHADLDLNVFAAAITSALATPQGVTA